MNALMALCLVCGLWFSEDNGGIGVWVSPDMGAGHAVIWYLFRADGTNAFLVARENCTEFPCTLDLHELTGPWLGGPEADFGEPVGDIRLDSAGPNQLIVSFNLIKFGGERCANISPGGVILRKCAGVLLLDRLTN